MFIDSAKSQLYPFLFNIINGGDMSLLKDSLNTTTHYFSFSSELQNSRNTTASNSSGQVAVINIHHPIFKYDQNCGPKGTQSIMNLMDEWKNDSNVVGVVFDVNSGGGQGSGNAEFAEYLNTYPKPTGVFTKDMIGSAAYYFSAGTDFIIAHKHADFIGCIGSMHYSVNVEGILKKKGATINEWYADISPEKNKQTRAMKDGDERPFVEKLLNPSAQQFHDDMKRYRPQISEKALEGDIFNPKDALKEGLIDDLGTLQSAIDKVFSLSKPSTNSTNNNSKRKTMSKSNLPLIEAVLGNKFEDDETKDGVILTEAQASLIENRLSENDKAISDAATLATANTAKITELTNTSAAVTTAVQNALKEAEVEGAEKMSNEEGIVALSALVKEYGSKDGGKTTQTIDSPDNAGSEDNNMVAGYDISAAMNN